MRTLLKAGAAALVLVTVPTALSAQQTADEANAQARPLPPTTSVTLPDPSATVTHNADGTVTVAPNPDAPAVVTRNNPGNVTTPPPQAFNKSYPVCTRELQDNCQNAGEGGAPGKSRALGYWPGEPASERTDRGG